MKVLLSMTDVARICKVARGTVIRWFDSGRLRGHRRGAARVKRVVTRDSLMRFLKEHGMPLGELAAEGPQQGTPPAG
jgi:hypothetical protein